MKRLILAAVAASMLALPTVQAEAAPREQPHHAQQWKKPGPSMNGKHVEKKHERKHVEKKYERKRQPQWRHGQKYSNWKRHQPVRDYHRHGLRRPAHGQEWIRVGNDYLLVGIATGLIFGAIAAN